MRKDRVDLSESLGPDNPVAREARQALTALNDERRRRAASFERIARERDPSRGARTRALAASSLALFAVVLSSVALNLQNADAPFLMVLYPTGLLVVFLATGIALRKRIVFTDYNRQVILFVLTLFAFIILGRVMGLFIPIATPDVIFRDLFVMAAMFSMASFTILRWARWLALVSIIFAVCVLLRPAWSQFIYGASIVITIGIGAWMAWRDR